MAFETRICEYVVMLIIPMKGDTALVAVSCDQSPMRQLAIDNDSLCVVTTTHLTARDGEWQPRGTRRSLCPPASPQESCLDICG